MTTDSLGRYFVTTALGVQVFDPTGRLCGVLDRPQMNKPLTSCVIAGPKRDLLYITNGDRIYRRRIQVAATPSPAR
jgi:enterochelin esterase family protein